MLNVKTVGLFDDDRPLHYVSEDLAIVDGVVIFRRPGRPTEQDLKKAHRATKMVSMSLIGELTKREDGLWQQRVLTHEQF